MLKKTVHALVRPFHLEALGYSIFYEREKRLIAVESDFRLLRNVYQTNILAVPEPV